MILVEAHSSHFWVLSYVTAFRVSLEATHESQLQYCLVKLYFFCREHLSTENECYGLSCMAFVPCQIRML